MSNYSRYRLLKRQHTLAPEQRIKVTRELIAARARQMKRYLQRGQREGLGDTAEALKKLKWATDQLPKAQTDSLTGLLGAASKEYYRAISGFLKGDWGYTTRKKPSPFNTLLDLAYAHIESTYQESLESVGLDPYDGVFLAERWGRANLARELSYPLRTALAEQLAVSVVNLGSITLKDLESPAKLSERGISRYRKAFEKRLARKITYRFAYADEGELMSYRDAIARQCQLYIEFCLGKVEFQALFLKWCALEDPSSRRKV